MAVSGGTAGIKVATAVYDFSRHGGAVGDIVLSAGDANGNSIPNGSVVIGGYIDVTTAVAAAGGTFALKIQGAADLLAGAAAHTTGRKDVVPDSTGSTAIKLTADRSITATVATAVATAGVLRVVLFYV